MSTRSRIGIDTSDAGDGSRITSIYCHFDGYPEGVGAVLAEHYGDKDAALALVALGDLSILGPELGEEHAFNTHPVDSPWTLAYGRDRGETGVEAKSHEAGVWPDSGQEYEYIFSQLRPNDPAWGWSVRETPFGHAKRGWRCLVDALGLENAPPATPAASTAQSRTVLLTVMVELPADNTATVADVSADVSAALTEAQETGTAPSLAYSYWRIPFAGLVSEEV